MTILIWTFAVILFAARLFFLTHIYFVCLPGSQLKPSLAFTASPA
jgi:hypothetical protein